MLNLSTARAAARLIFAGLLALGGTAAAPAQDRPRYDGFNVIVSAGHPFGSVGARRSLTLARRTGAAAVAIVPFLWQPNTASPAIGRGSDMSNEELRTAIRDARAQGLRVMVKPHVWVPQRWAGAVLPGSEADWRAWFENYRTALLTIARIAAEERADALSIGTELKETSRRPEWIGIIGAVRAVFPRTLLYVAHNLEEAETVPFWPLLDAIGVTLYPVLGDDHDRPFRLAAMTAVAEKLDALAERTGKPVIVGEIGLRSAEYAASKPWESPEERPAEADGRLQAEVMADWLNVLRRPGIDGVLVWRWLTDPHAGGPNDTDFTVQNKPAEGVLLCAWTVGC